MTRGFERQPSTSMCYLLVSLHVATLVQIFAIGNNMINLIIKDQ